MDKTQRGYLILIFFLSPLLGLLTLFKSKNKKFFEFFGVFFFGLVGSLFVYVDGTDGHSHYQNAKEHYLNMSFVEYLERSYEVITFNSTEVATDMYLHTISFISASIFQAPSLIHVFTDKDCQVKVLDNEIIIESLLANSFNCTVIGNVSSVLFYAPLFGHKSISMFDRLKDKPKTAFDDFDVYWKNIIKI